MTSKPDITGLTPDEKLALLEEIWDSLTPDDVRLTREQEEELARRIEDLERSPGDSVSLDEALRMIRERGR